ncbi:MAG: hypothetical protein OES57_06640 [Acidimicrobiia bacterium]|nr:hypothetical protein [Acidimicrobiia bacterium]
MPEPLSPSDDELVSAYFDGEASADEVVRVEASPELMAEVEAMRAVASVVGRDPDPGSVDPARRDAQITAALEASTTAANVTSLTTSRARPWYRQPVAAVAAVLLAALIAVPLLANLGNSDDDVATSASTDEDGADAASADLEGGEAAATNTQRSAPAELDSGALLDADDAAADGGAGDEAAEAPAAIEVGDDAASFYARLVPSTSDNSFATIADAVDAFDELTGATDEAEEGAGAVPVDVDDAATTAETRCGAIFTAEVLVAEVDDVGKVLVGTVGDETVVVSVSDQCDQLFPDE